MTRPLREVVFVDGVRTPFGKAKGQYAETRADDLVVKLIRELVRRHPELPPERIDEVAIAAITRVPAEALGLGARYGTITAGKVANLVLWAGDPLEISTRVVELVIRGKKVSLESRQSALLQKYRRLPLR